MRTLLSIVLMSVLACAIGGCASADSDARGYLVIAGGAVEEDSREVYSAFIARLPTDAVIGVLPTASGVPETSGASAAATLRMYAGTRDVRIIDLTTKNPQDASNPDVVNQIDACQGLWFTGGDQKRIVSVFRPVVSVAGGPGGAGGTVDTPAYHAARRVLQRGGAIGGTSAGAAMMSESMILGGRSEDALLGLTRENSEETSFSVGPGMAFLPFGMTDQHFLRRGRLGRLVVALEMTGKGPGFGVEENCAVGVDLTSGSMEVLGPGAAMVVVDISGVTRDGDTRRGVRVSLLHSGDQIHGKSGTVRAAGTAVASAYAGGTASVASEAVGSENDAWSRGAVVRALAQLAREPQTPVVLKSPSFDVRFSSDRRTAFYSVAGGEPTVVDALLDIVRR